MEEVARGVHRLGSEYVGWYLCEGGDGITVVDCGLSGYFDQLPAALAELGRPLDAITAVVLTHYHTDHVGSAERIRTEAGARVLAPEGDVAGVKGGKTPAPGGLMGSVWRPRIMRFMVHATRNGGARQIPVREVEGYADGQVLDVPGRLRVVHTPGHTGGHCSLLAEEAGVLFAGDALTTAPFFTGHDAPSVHPFNEDDEQARHSLSRLDELPADVVVFGHGRPFAGSPADAVAQARALSSR